MNANEMAKLLKNHDSCAGLDEWIKTELFTRFCRSGTGKVNVDTLYIRNCGWGCDEFEFAMRSRLYIIEYKCEDRPCASPYYIISLPVENIILNRG